MVKSDDDVDTLPPFILKIFQGTYKFECSTTRCKHEASV